MMYVNITFIFSVIQANKQVAITVISRAFLFDRPGDKETWCGGGGGEGTVPLTVSVAGYASS